MQSNLFVLSTLLLAASVCSAQWVVDFEDLSLPADSAAPGDPTETPFVSQLVSFNRTWNQDFDCCPGAWAYSNRTDLTTAGFTNPFSAYALPQGGGVDGSDNFAVAGNSFLGDAQVTLPAATTVQGLRVTNTTYAYLAVAVGNDGQHPGNPPLFVKGPFEAGDWFKLEIVGRNSAGSETGRVPFYLADFRDGATTVIDHWTWVDLEGLGNQVSFLAFELTSTDNGMFGMNTPAYFAIDNLTIATLPGDFDSNFAYACEDVDALVAEIVAGTNDPEFDLDADGLVDAEDLTVWLAIAGAASSPTGAAFLPGDANLDGTVDGADFLVWNNNKFAASAAWCRGDFDASGFVDGNDFLVWNAFKFPSADSPIPEPTALSMLLLAWAFLWRRKQIPR